MSEQEHGSADASTSGMNSLSVVLRGKNSDNLIKSDKKWTKRKIKNIKKTISNTDHHL